MDGALAVNAAKTAFSEAYAAQWLFFYGATFIVIVLYLPKGLAGIYSDHVKNWIDKVFQNSKSSDSLALGADKISPNIDKEENSAK